MKTSRILTTVFSGLFIAGAAGADEDARPNVLFIMSDDLRTALGCYGNRQVITPNIDQLASSGFVFRRSYCQMAVCNASRSSLLTGWRLDSLRFENSGNFRKNSPGIITLPQHFKNNGYHTIGIGKIFHGDDDEVMSWSEPWWTPDRSGYLKTWEERRAEGQKMGLSGERLRQFVRPVVECTDAADEEYKDGMIAERALEVMRRVKDRPFFLAVGFSRPHLPFACPKKYWDLYDREKIKAAENRIRPDGIPDYTVNGPLEIESYGKVPVGTDGRADISADQAKELTHGYYASVSFVDALVGKLLNELQRLGLDKKTIVVLIGDHGFHLGERGHWSKFTNYEVDAAAPLIVRAPSMKYSGYSTLAITEFVDIYPSLCELAGLPLPEQRLEGTSFVPLVNINPELPWKKAAFTQYNRPANHGGMIGRTVRTEYFRYVEWEKDSAVIFSELYDHRADPDEMVNLAFSPEWESVAAELSGLLHNGWESALPDLKQK